MSAHPTNESDFDLYALGALEGAELREFEDHVAGCGDCAPKLAQARGRLAMLALVAPQVAPSAAAKSRLMARVDANAAAAAGSVRRSLPDPGRLSRWWATILMPAAAALAVATLVLWQQNDRLDQQLAALRNAASKQQAQVAEATKLADLMGSSGTVTVSLAQQPGMPKGTAHVIYNMKMGMLMYDGQLEAAPSGKSYQLWVVPAQGNPISAGVFQPVSGQMDHWMMEMPQGLVPKAFAVTLEPAGGMPQPTGPKVLVGAAS
jgi:anti-sigma-K factor RskA